MEYADVDLTIVYDTKYMESPANIVSNTLAGKYNCIVQRLSVFEKEKDAVTNNNKILFIFKDRLELQWYVHGNATEYVIDCQEEVPQIYARLWSNGNRRCIWVDVDKSIDSCSRRNRWEYFKMRVFSYPCKLLFGINMIRAIESILYEYTMDFFLKEENLKLIIPD